MGKAKRARTKLHTPAVRNDTSDNNTSLATSTPPTSKTDYSKVLYYCEKILRILLVGAKNGVSY